MLICPLCEEENETLRTDAVDEEIVTKLASAIRRPDVADAEFHLDKLVGENSQLQWAVSMGRFGGRAKAA